ncbi:DeSI-like protein [Drosera capensis]
MHSEKFHPVWTEKCYSHCCLTEFWALLPRMGTMKLRLKKGRRTVMPLPIRAKSATRFSLFSKVKSSSIGPGSTPVYLNVYDMISMNKYLNWAGLGVFHSGVEDIAFVSVFCNLHVTLQCDEMHGVEYAFGARDDPTSCISEV